MTRLLLIGLGGFVGSICRYQLSLWLTSLAAPDAGARFPFGILGVNLLGCLVAGLLTGAIARHGWFSPDVRVMLMVGVLGGFTTFSAFGMDTLALLRRGDIAMAALYVGLTVVVGLVLAWFGWRLAAGPAA
ncbi:MULTISPECIES: fluoride efflux transporter CrcB [Luteimonas]|uniref:fluoride efflux transporter CrcB n=1 Tax=Luteimonas TaxID=83614 RepID=UPI000C7C221B|nr:MULTISPECIES: fluoride efflux transporter CrcB [Luteimonas]